MQILVPLKQILDSAGFTVNRKVGKVFVNEENYIVNPADRRALEAALRLKDSHGANVIAAGLGPARTEDVLREALAMGADRAMLFIGEPFEDRYRLGETRPMAAAEVPSSRVRSLGQVEFQPDPIPLRKARRIVSVGRWGNDAATVEAAKKIAAALEAHFAGDRSAFDAGFIAREQIVGVVGEEVAPDVYFAIGVWGDGLHNAGIERARKVVAVHRDPRAPILKVADVAVVAEPKELLPKLLEKLRAYER